MTENLPVATQSQLQLPALIAGNNLKNLRALVARKSPLHDHFAACCERIAHMAECQATFNESAQVAELDHCLRELLDAQSDSQSIKDAVNVVAEAHGIGHFTGNTSESIFERTEVAKTTYRDMTDMNKYGRSRQYDDFKRRVFDIEHPDDDYPGTESFFKTHAPQDDDELEMTYQTKRSLKCPITMTNFIHPVRCKLCPHIFSRDAIMEMLRRNRGTIKCPVAGCDKNIKAQDLERDRAMERRVREEEDDLGQAGEELSSGNEDEDVLDIL